MTNRDRVAPPPLSVVVLCRNERDHIGPCLESILGSAFSDLEVLVVDGMSDDGSREIVARFIAADVRVRLVDNPGRITPVAMNLGIKNSQGDVIAIVSAHAVYDKTYFGRCLQLMEEYSADQVGSVAHYVPRSPTLIGRAISASLSHPFGAGANARYKTGTKRPAWADTAFSSCFRRELFDRVGLFNERLVRSQDFDFANRVRRAGGRVLVAPDHAITYFARSGLWDSTRYNFWNGYWVTFPFAVGVRIGRLRHLVPMAFVLTLAMLGLAAFWLPVAWSLLLGVSALYLVTSVLASIHCAIIRRDVVLVTVMPLIFASLHIPYGLGSAWGFVRAGLARDR